MTSPVYEPDDSIDDESEYDGPPMSGVIYCGDNLEVLRDYIPDSSVDLVYLDPPFNSQRNYHVVYEGSQALEEAFKDCWSWEEAAPAFARMMESTDVPKAVKLMLRSLKELLSEQDSDLLAYLTMMAPRLVAMHAALKATGSLYLHCDPTASHYLKMLLDAIFGTESFRGDITWQRTNARSTAGNWPRVHDTILYYSKGKAPSTFRGTYVPGGSRKVPHTLITGADGKKYQTYELTAPGRTKLGESGRAWRGFNPGDKWDRHWANNQAQMEEWNAAGLIHWPKNGGFPRRRADKPFVAEDREVLVGDVWTDIDRLNQTSKERTKYPTQKPLKLLERILQASSNPGDLVLDPFCGCGTTVEAAERMGRRWIGIDIASTAVDVIEARFKRVDLSPPEIIWHPADEEAAKAMVGRGEIRGVKRMGRTIRVRRSALLAADDEVA